MAGEAEDKTPEEIQAEQLRGIGFSSTYELTGDRRACMDHKVGPVRTAAETITGVGTFPPVADYCMEAIRVQVTGTLPFDPYVDMTREQLGLPGNVNRDDDYKAVGAENIAGHVWAVVQSANNGANAYGGFDRELHRVTCPLALDAGATWLATRPEEPIRFPLTDAEIATLSRACYDPAVTEMPFREHGNVPITTLGLLVGENLGRAWMEQRDESALSPSLTPPAAASPGPARKAP